MTSTDNPQGDAERYPGIARDYPQVMAALTSYDEYVSTFGPDEIIAYSEGH